MQYIHHELLELKQTEKITQYSPLLWGIFVPYVPSKEMSHCNFIVM